MTTATKSTGKTRARPARLADENALHKIPLRITDTTLRDAHQSLWATRMRTQDIVDIMDAIDSVGYYSLEVWGGATFDVCLRFLRENPWERLRAMKARAKNTPLQMLLRGQNLVGYRNYADDVVDRFVALARENGIDIFRVFDALNDVRNLEAAVKAVKRHGGHAQGTLCYTISPVHTVEKFVEHAKEQVAIGIDSLCIKDMAGILSPIMAERVVSALVRSVSVPIQLHCHATSGMAVATYVEGVRAGAGAIDCAISPVAGFSSQPPVETMATIFSETGYSASLDVAAMAKVAKYFEDLAPRRRQASSVMGAIDPGILVHQVPGGMISNFRSQLDKQGALEKLPEALEEVTRVRKDLGYPPLVTPTSQIVGTQAVMNVLSGERYKVVPNEVKDYARGLYGRSPAPMDRELVIKILGDEKPIEGRPADRLEPMLPKATEGLDHDLVEHEEDIISYCLLPEVAVEYFKWRKLPREQRPPTPADVELQKEAAAAAPAPAAPAAPSAPAAGTARPEPLLSQEDYEGLSQMLAQVSATPLNEIVVRKGEFTLVLRAGGAGEPPSVEAAQAAAQPATPTAAPAQGAATPAAEAKSTANGGAPAPAPAAPAPEQPAYTHTIKSPLAGTFYAASGPGKPPLVNVGDTVKAGQTVCIVEAMKLFNEIKTDKACKIVAILVAGGTAVVKDQPLVAVEPV